MKPKEGFGCTDAYKTHINKRRFHKACKKRLENKPLEYREFLMVSLFDEDCLDKDINLTDVLGLWDRLL